MRLCEKVAVTLGCVELLGVEAFGVFGLYMQYRKNPEGFKTHMKHVLTGTPFRQSLDEKH